MTAILIKRGKLNIDRQTHTHTHTGRMPCEDEGRDGDDAAKIKEH